MLVPLRIASLVAAAAAAATGRRELDHTPFFNGGEEGWWTLPGSTKAYNLQGTDVTCTSAEMLAYVNTGQTVFGTGCVPTNYAHSMNNLHFHELDFTDMMMNKLIYNNLGGQGPNNGCGCFGDDLGNNGCPSWPEGTRPTANYPSTGAVDNGRFGLDNSCIPGAGDQVDPARIELDKIAMVKCDGVGVPALASQQVNAGVWPANALTNADISTAACFSADTPNDLETTAHLRLRLYSTSVYRPADFGVHNNMIQMQAEVPSTPSCPGTVTCTSTATGGMMQINLRPFYNEFATAPMLEDSYYVNNQPFMTTALKAFLSQSGTLAQLQVILPDLGSNMFDARYTNSVTLALVFTTQSGAPYIMDELYLSFFDFDQDYADGSFGLVRENLLAYEFTTAFLEDGTEIESGYTGTSAFLTLAGGVPVRQLPSGPTANCPYGGYYKAPFSYTGPPGEGDWVICADTVSLQGGSFRSRRHGSGQPRITNQVKEKCMGFCSRGSMTKTFLANGQGMNPGTCSGNRGVDLAIGAAMDIYDQFCPADTPCTPVSGGGLAGTQPTWTWTGCGFSDSGGYNSVADGTGAMAINGVYYRYELGESIACALDCPRIINIYQKINGVETTTLVPGSAMDPANDNCMRDGGNAPICGMNTCDDAGNPTDVRCLSKQQKRRAVTLLFRSMWRIMIQFRTEVGVGALMNPQNDLFDVGDSLTSLKQFPNIGQYASVYGTTALAPTLGGGFGGIISPSTVTWDGGVDFSQPFCSDTNAVSSTCHSMNSMSENPADYNPDKGRLTLGSQTDPKGRNFLFGSYSSLVCTSGCTVSPPPPPPPPPPPCICDNSCPFANNGVCDDMLGFAGMGAVTGDCTAYGRCTDCVDCGPCDPTAECYPPPPPSGETCTACLDPHLTFAHGGRADFKGKDKTWYPMLSARNATMNMFFEHDDFKNLYKVVHGSAMKAAAWVLRTNVTGKIVTIEYNASVGEDTRAFVKVSDSPRGVWLAHGQKALVYENVRIEMLQRKLSGAAKKAFHGVALVVSTGQWQMTVWAKPYPNAPANPGKALLNIHVEALYDADTDPVAPHGLIGQSYDGDALPVDGEVDDYQGKEITTKAMAEGAIEGVASEYELHHKFATRFKYSRFDATAAKHRDPTQLKGKSTKPRSKEAFAASAKADLEDEDEDAK